MLSYKTDFSRLFYQYLFTYPYMETFSRYGVEMSIFPRIILPVDTILIHSTIRKSQEYMEELKVEAEYDEDLKRWSQIISHYEKLNDGEFPTSLDQPKWFSLPSFIYGGKNKSSVVLKYKLLRPVVLADLRNFSVENGTTKLPKLDFIQSEMDDMKMFFASCKFEKDTWMYKYYSADTFNITSSIKKELTKELKGVDGWIAYDWDDTSWSEIMLVNPQDVIDSKFEIICKK